MKLEDMGIKGIIFDMDGTLLDSMPTWDKVGSALLQRKGIESHEDIDERMKNIGFDEALCYYNETLELGMTLEMMKQEINAIMQEAYETVIELKEDTKEVLQALKQKGYKLCIATATDNELAVLALKRLGIFDDFEFVISCSDVGCWKDDPKIYQEATKMLGLKEEEVVIVEDAGYCVETAKKAGFKVVGIYDASAEMETALIRTMSDLYILKLSEVL